MLVPSRFYTLEAFPANHRLTLRSLGDLYFEELNWRAAVEAYQGAIHAGDLLLAAAYTTAGRRAEVSATAHLHARTAYSLLRLGRPNESLRWLDQWKTRLLNETLALGAVDLAALPEDQRRSLMDARQAIRELEAEVLLPPDTPARRSDAVLHGRLRQARDAPNKRFFRLIEDGQFVLSRQLFIPIPGRIEDSDSFARWGITIGPHRHPIMHVFGQKLQPFMGATLVQPSGFTIEELLHLADELFIHA